MKYGQGLQCMRAFQRKTDIERRWQSYFCAPRHLLTLFSSRRFSMTLSIWPTPTVLKDSSQILFPLGRLSCLLPTSARGPSYVLSQHPTTCPDCPVSHAPSQLPLYFCVSSQETADTSCSPSYRTVLCLALYRPVAGTHSVADEDMNKQQSMWQVNE